MNYKELDTFIKEYCEKYRGPGLLPYAHTELYDLYPEIVDTNSSKARYEWPGSWPHPIEGFQKYTHAGVYIFFDKELNVIYVGKASQNSAIFSRLATYFKNDQDKCLFTRPWWEIKPKYIKLIFMPEGHKFEAPALEEYLIDKIQPYGNSQGISEKK
ncbi:MAG: GIY-YIG nuclease family protein [Leptospiraceae bacterium]|nr:GIY-YIG nuclease family protein [Leptospiraceae bacterium]